MLGRIIGLVGNKGSYSSLEDDNAQLAAKAEWCPAKLEDLSEIEQNTAA
jgi:hypothetical protein